LLKLIIIKQFRQAAKIIFLVHVKSHCIYILRSQNNNVTFHIKFVEYFILNILVNTWSL